jgi:hypothetical protein
MDASMRLIDARNVVYVYCDGPADAPHPRYKVRIYARVLDREERVLDGEPRWVCVPRSLYRPFRESGKLSFAGHSDKVRLHCPDCRFNEKRRLDRHYGPEFPPFSAVFEKLWANGLKEISVRELVARVAWP